MTKKLKVATVIGTRPEIIRLSRVIAKLDVHCEHILIHTGQNYDYELNEVFFKDLELRKPDFFLNAAGTSAAETIGNVIISVDKILEEIRPDALLILGDTNSCLSAIPAKRRKIPIFHMEAGNRCFDQRVPEETNRKIVDHIADINMPYSGIAREYLLREGIPPDRIIKTGSPMFEVLAHNRSKIESSDVLQRLGLSAKSYFVASIHREENVDNPKKLEQIFTAFNSIASEYTLPIIFSTHPRTRKRIEGGDIKFHPLVRIHKPLGFIDYNALQLNAKVVLSDSGTISEESSILGFPALNIREAHERPEAMEEAVVMMTGCNAERVVQCLRATLLSEAFGVSRFRIPSDYSVHNVSEKVIRVLHTYVDYVRINVWRL